ncbi:MAG: type II secretion system protein [Candidatus Harrisonbacteria bacterium]|nr:type II secretion system protein [Candidatus Harrisonbacteria bacterium]
MKTKGFTLLELVIVIGILAVLGAVSVLVLNPAQLFAQARDTTRIEDMGVLRNALALYVSTLSSPDLDGPGVKACATMCFVQTGGMSANCAGRHAAARVTDATAARVVDGTGWVPVNFGAVPGGPALSVLPIDPTNDTNYFYSYACDNTAKTYELNANMESTRYASGGADDKETNTKDGGNADSIYEVGTDAGLDL